MRDAISLLDSCAAGGLPVDEALVERQLGLSSCEVLLRMFESISRSDTAAALNVLDGVYRSSVSLSVFLEDMLIMTRDLLVAGSVSGAEPSFVMSDAESGRFRALCGSLRTESLLHAAEVLEDIYVKSGKYSENMKLIFEIALLELCSPHSVRPLPRCPTVSVVWSAGSGREHKRRRDTQTRSNRSVKKILRRNSRCRKLLRATLTLTTAIRRWISARRTM